MVGGGIRDRSVPFQCLRLLLFVSSNWKGKGGKVVEGVDVLDSTVARYDLLPLLVEPWGSPFSEGLTLANLHFFENSLLIVAQCTSLGMELVAKLVYRV